MSQFYLVFSSMVWWFPELPSHSHDVIIALIIASVDFHSNDVHAVWNLLSRPIATDLVSFVSRPIFVNNCLTCVRFHSESNDSNILDNCHTYLFHCLELTQINCLFISVALCISVLEPRALDSVWEPKLNPTKEFYVFISTWSKINIEFVFVYLVLDLCQPHILFTNW